MREAIGYIDRVSAESDRPSLRNAVLNAMRAAKLEPNRNYSAMPHNNGDRGVVIAPKEQSLPSLSSTLSSQSEISPIHPSPPPTRPNDAVSTHYNTLRIRLRAKHAHRRPSFHTSYERSPDLLTFSKPLPSSARPRSDSFRVVDGSIRLPPVPIEPVPRVEMPRSRLVQYGEPHWPPQTYDKMKTGWW